MNKKFEKKLSWQNNKKNHNINNQTYLFKNI